MKIAFIYPPFTKGGKFADLPQNRQFIYTSSSFVKPYPYVMAVGATWASKMGHEVVWLDGISRRLPWGQFDKLLDTKSLDLVVLEGKTPIMNKLWNYIKKLKKINKKLIVVLVGDHPTNYPKESFVKSKVDYLLCGGDYDFLLKKLIEHITHIKSKKKLGPGIWYRKNGRAVSSGQFKLNNNLNLCPSPDRKLTRYFDYGEAYLFKPAAYIMSGRGCGIDTGRSGICTFCIWQNTLWRRTARLRNPKLVAQEVAHLVSLGVKEIFDDNESGGLWDKLWLKAFYDELKKQKVLGKIVFSSNARADQLTPEVCRLLVKLNYRLLKVGLESGSDNSLTQICKRETIKQIIDGVKCAKDYGLRVMLTIMVGYPWETEEEVKQTYDVAKELTLYKTYAGDCLQASVITPYPGTPLWFTAKKNKWFKETNLKYDDYDMEKPILKSKYNAPLWCKKIWSIQKEPLFILKSGLSIRSWEEIKLLARGAISLLGHTQDYHE